jgi:hypothetical protein
VRVLVVDGANVVRSRPDGWWRDRAGAAARLHRAIASANLGFDEVLLVLEGAAKGGQPEGEHGATRAHTHPVPGMTRSWNRCASAGQVATPLWS